MNSFSMSIATFLYKNGKVSIFKGPTPNVYYVDDSGKKWKYDSLPRAWGQFRKLLRDYETSSRDVIFHYGWGYVELKRDGSGYYIREKDSSAGDTDYHPIGDDCYIDYNEGGRYPNLESALYKYTKLFRSLS